MSRQSANNRNTIYKEILDKIQYCEWVPGTLVSETRLAERFGLSRTPVREVLFVLAQEGYVDIVPQSGTYVSRIDLKRVQELLFMRYHLELPILEKLARDKAVPPASIDRLLQEMEQKAAEGSWKEAVNLDYLIHEELVRFSGHEHIWDRIRSELPHFTRFRFFEPYHREFTGDSPRALEEHAALIACLKQGDAAGLRRIMKSHYDYTLELRRNYNIRRISLHPDYFPEAQLKAFLNGQPL